MDGLDISLPAASVPSGQTEPQRWRILDAGDTVSVDGGGVYEIIHVSEGKAWVCALSGGMQMLVNATRLTLVQPLCPCPCTSQLH